ncbi:MAG TPA: ATP-binding protein [Thermoanaerobaculia bacterium]|nr:ATP-binding protein [Thermoanaerobaculia bacterium]
MKRRVLSPIAIRLLLFNVLLVFLPVAGLLSLSTFERQLLDLQERAMVQQARLAAAALSSGTETIDPAAARELIQRLGGRSESRIRILDRSGNVVADSAASRPAPVEQGESANPPRAVSRDRLLYRIGAWMWRKYERVRDLVAGGTPSSAYGTMDRTPREVIDRALSGRYGATVRASEGQRSLTLYSALPVREGGRGAVIGAVMVSQSTSRILRALWRVRLSTFQVFVASVAVAVVLSLLISATIARPLIRLRNEADALLDHRGRLRRRFGGSLRRDEIGDLTRALEQLTIRLERHLAFVESFSADVSHEFRNPLASIRNAAELLPETNDPEERRQLGATIEKEVTRLSRLLGAVREVSKVDAAVDMEATQTVDLGTLWDELAQRDRIDVAASQTLLVNASRDRLLQAFGNIVDNAVSFSPPDGRVRLAAAEENGFAVVTLDDDGPGIPPEHIERIFERFFSFRPGEDAQRNHDGLGLAIAKAIVEAYGGTIRATNLSPHGTRIEVRLPPARR